MLLSVPQKLSKFLAGTPPNILELKNFSLNFTISRLFANNPRMEEDIINWKSALKLKTTDTLLGSSVIMYTLVH